MNILNALERVAFDVPPVFNSGERKKHFDAPVGIRDLANQLRTATNQVGFLLAAGYFSATKKFYAVKRFHERDIDYVCCQMGVSPQQFNRVDYDKQTLLRHQGFIRQFYGFREFDAQAERFAHQEAEGMVRSSTNRCAIATSTGVSSRPRMTHVFDLSDPAPFTGSSS